MNLALTKTMLGTNDAHIRMLAENLNITTVQDFFEYFPRDYEDLSSITLLKDFRLDRVNVSRGMLGPISSARSGSGRAIQKALFTDHTGDVIECIWFGQKFLKTMFKPGMQVLIAGSLKIEHGKRVLVSPTLEAWNPDTSGKHIGRIVPIYSASGKLSAKWLREKIFLLKKYLDDVVDFLPEEILARENLLTRSEALRSLHFPKNYETLHRAQERLAFEEALLFQITALKVRHDVRQNHNANKILLDPEIIKKYFSLQKFTPTNAQKKSLYEILKDMESDVPMVRLLQGDVGSGKTFVALAAAFHAIHAGHQVALLAPTEILARQHFQKISAELSPLGIEVQLLLGATKIPEKKKIKEDLSNGKINFLIGTHAIITPDISFKNLALAIVDEQHRFGVEQRETLRQNGTPHFIALSATPIPRSLALVLFGDTDVSIIDELPPDRQQIFTKIILPVQQRKALYFIQDELKKGRQVFFVYPLVDESEVLQNVRSAKKQFSELKEFFSEYKVGLLHGQMKSEEKEKVMQKFLENKIQVLVSTSVIEVGIDIPNATIMVVEESERFGLAQLHQIRGRVGRGREKSYCFLFTSNDDKAQNERLQALEKTTDGFRLAEVDLQLRGPGSFFGIAQSGFPDFRMANLLDTRLIMRCRENAEELLCTSPDLSDFPLLAKRVQNFSFQRA